MKRLVAENAYQNDATAPNDCLPSIVFDIREDFRSHVYVVPTLILDGSIKAVDLFFTVRVYVLKVSDNEPALWTDENPFRRRSSGERSQT